jgi:cyclophilin family peptidyl-prolyl cis-trans isomerase
VNTIRFLLAASLACAGVATAAAQSNSLVRFRLSYGTTFFGDIDVELFDADKPDTVANFLAYVQSGAYDNSVLHECVPGVALVGGLGTVPNPYSPAPLEIFSQITRNAAINNEFNVGTQRSNVLGTLSMLKDDTNDVNSATSRWFFNLGNNNEGSGATNLDTYIGGHTVFGEVTAGLNVLTFFNTFYEGYGIQDMLNDFHAGSCAELHRFPDGEYIGFPSIPVGFTGIDCIRYNDLFTVQIFLLEGAADRTRPKVTITAPTATADGSSGDLAIEATATDDVEVAIVRVYLNTNAPVELSGDGFWSVTLNDVPPGTNTVVVEAIDTTGNHGQASRTFFYSVRQPLMLGKVGEGILTGLGATNGALLELGRGYTLIARPASGYLFAGWTGSVSQAAASLTFLMEPTTSLTAVFVTNLFPTIKGTYTGLFYDTNLVDQQSSGLLSLTLGDFGAYSAKLILNGRSHRFAGTFGPDGGETNFITRAGTNDLLVRMAVDLIGNTFELTGLLTNFHATATETNAWGAQLMADRAFFTSANPTALAGHYTLLIPPDLLAAAGPSGDGFGAVTVSTSGRVSLRGSLADGTKVAQKAPLSKDNRWPLYLALHKGKGALVSWVTFDTNNLATDFSGRLNWFKQSQAAAKYYPGGFTNESDIAGSRFLPATPMLDLTDATIAFSGGNLITDFANSVTLGVDNRVTNNSPNKLTLTLSKSSGLFTGTVTTPDGTRSIPYRGAVLQKQARGAGFFLGTNQSGRVQLLAE